MSIFTTQYLSKSCFCSQVRSFQTTSLVTFSLNCQRYTTNTQAAALFQQAAAIAATVTPHLDQLQQEKNSLSIQGRALMDSEIQRIDQINALLERYDWFKTHHLPAQELKVQQECLQVIQLIQQEIAAIELD